MARLNDEMLKVAEQHIGEPFYHHFRPNLCQGGLVTLDSCMEHGMDESGFDCSGLIVASLSEVLGTKVEDWPRELRHIQQLSGLVTDQDPEIGDVLLIDAIKNGDTPLRPHCGVLIDYLTMVHSNGYSKVVELGVADGMSMDIQILPISVLADAVQS